ncbi:MAG: DEAD/DEAH box helicase [Nanoarchaeota archaeon]|nr:DEAD/DEAH box helicase [Nanoarchaeota archaeon]
MEEFRKLGLSENALQALQKKGYTTPTEIQRKAIPILLEGKHDIIAQSQTGTGKTASFALPIIEKVKENAGHVQAIILTPTRELALQVAKEFESLMGKKRLRVLPVYGGASVSEQRDRLRQGIDIVVGTPGRVIDQLERKSLNLSMVSFTVLDEADEMLNMGFLEDIETILKSTNAKKRMLLFSATMPKPIVGIARKFMHEPIMLEIERQQQNLGLTEHIYYELRPGDRFECLRRILDVTKDFYGIVFCKTRSDVDDLSRKLMNAGYSAAAIHGDISQDQREKILQSFRQKRITVLVATDVAARGIDVNDLTHVVNYSLPQSSELYVHRTGRTGRAGKKGIAITFVVPSEKGKFRFMEKRVHGQLHRREVPSIDDVKAMKSENVKLELATILKADASGKYTALAKEILISNPPVPVVAALLKQVFQSTERDNYGEIEKTTSGQRDDRRERRGDRHGSERRKPWHNRRGGRR